MSAYKAKDSYSLLSFSIHFVARRSATYPFYDPTTARCCSEQWGRGVGCPTANKCKTLNEF